LGVSAIQAYTDLKYNRTGSRTKNRHAFRNRHAFGARKGRPQSKVISLLPETTRWLQRKIFSWPAKGGFSGWA